MAFLPFPPSAPRARVAPVEPPSPLAIWDRAPDAASRRAALIVLAVSTAIFVALVPLAKLQLAPAAWFIPLLQSGLILNDLITAGLLLGQLRLTRRVEPLVLVGGYLYSAMMAATHLLTFPGVFSPGGLLGAGPQTTGYLHVFWHIGLPCAVIANVFLRERPLRMPRLRAAIAAMFATVAVLAAGFALLATAGGDLLPPMLAGDRYSSAFNLGRYGQWLLTGAAALLLWRRGIRSVLELWLVVMLADAFFEIGLVSIFNNGRYDLGFYAGRVYALLSSCVVLVMLLVEHGKLHLQLVQAQRIARSEAALRESREALRLAMHGGRMAAWSRDLASARTEWTPEVEQLTGWPAEAFNASDSFFLERVHPDDRNAARQALEPSSAPLQEFSVEFRMRTADEGWRWLDCRGEPLPGEQAARPARIFGVLIDITERKDSERAVATVLESITDAFFAVDAEWRFTYVNREAERLLQRRRADLLGHDMWAEFPSAVGTTFQREYERVRERRETVSFEEYYSELGIWVEVRAFPAGSGVSVYFRDVSARRKAQEELRRSEERYRLLADMIPQHIWVTGADGYHNFFSRSWYEYTGTAAGETDGEGWLRLLHPDDRERTLRAWKHSRETGEPYTIEYRFRGADGSYRWFNGQAAPLRNSEGTIIQWFGTLTDISERKEHDAERERLLAREREARAEAERRRAELEQVTESRSRLMRGFSHDLRSPLGAADMSASLLEDGRAYGALGDKQREAVRRIRRGIRTSLRLIDDLLELERAESGQVDLERVEVELAEAARETVDMFQAQAAAAGVAMDLRVPDGLRAWADPIRVRQVLANLVSNAIKYAPRARATVQVSSPSHGGEPPGTWAALSVIDTGPGIPEDKREFVFQEYARLDPNAQQGTGIGLAISRRIARLMGGDLTLESEAGRGCAFTLWLPLAANPHASTPQAGTVAARHEERVGS